MKKLGVVLIATVVFAAAAEDPLRREALRYGLKPVPKDFQILLKTIGADAEDYTAGKIALGRKLFSEKSLSLDGDVSCASCHNPEKGGADARPTAIGHEKRANPFHLNTPTVLNTALSRKLFWNGRSATLEEQAKGPIIAPFEMASSPTLIEARLGADRTYAEAFERVYGARVIRFDDVVDAISAYERTLITRGRFDDFLEGEQTALNAQEREGLRLYLVKGCVGCHFGMGLGGQGMRKFPIMRHTVWSLGDNRANGILKETYEGVLAEIEETNVSFTDDTARRVYLHQKLGDVKTRQLKKGYFDMLPSEKVYEVMTTKGCYVCHEKTTYRVRKETLAASAYPFENRGGFLGRGKRSRYFRVPLLRNVVSTEPYFHNGGIEKLQDAVRLMVTYQMRSSISDEEVAALIAFLKAVDGERVDYEVPPEAPTGF